MNAPIVLSYRLEPETIALGTMALSTALTKAARPRGPAGHWPTIAVWLALAAVCFWATTWQGGESGLLLPAVLIGVVLGGAGVLVRVQANAQALINHIGALIADEGQWHCEITPERITERSDLSLRRQSMSAVQEVLATESASVLVSHGFGFIIPDAALPDGMTPEAFRARVAGWAEAAREGAA